MKTDSEWKSGKIKERGPDQENASQDGFRPLSKKSSPCLSLFGFLTFSPFFKKSCSYLRHICASFFTSIGKASNTPLLLSLGFCRLLYRHKVTLSNSSKSSCIYFQVICFLKATQNLRKSVMIMAFSCWKFLTSTQENTHLPEALPVLELYCCRLQGL